MNNRLLVHSCCGPCLLYPERMMAADWHITAFFYNPNVHPRWEWARRRDTLAAHLKGNGMRLIVEDYEPNIWSRAVLTGKEDPVPERCRRCYELRLSVTAQRAANDGYDAFTTTLLVSPYQDHDAVVEAGKALGDRYGVPFLDEDFREGYKWGVGRSKQLQMYRQNYCGCILSLIERGQSRRLARGVKVSP